jgi:outer membrane protein OmpA-like peptidoglycan-associated protein
MNEYSISPTPSTSPRAQVQTGIPQQFVLDNFRYNRSELSSDHRRALDNLAKLIADTHQTAQPVLLVVLVGHADKAGSVTYNHLLGLKRAYSAAAYLLNLLHRKYRNQLKFPVPVTLNSEGELTPISNVAGKNRRVEIWLKAEAPRRPQRPAPPAYRPHRKPQGHRPIRRPSGQVKRETLLDEILSYQE